MAGSCGQKCPSTAQLTSIACGCCATLSPIGTDNQPQTDVALSAYLKKYYPSFLSRRSIASSNSLVCDVRFDPAILHRFF